MKLVLKDNPSFDETNHAIWTASWQTKDKVNLNDETALALPLRWHGFRCFVWQTFQMKNLGASPLRVGSMRHKTTQTVFSYFNRIRAGQAAPLRSDIDPADLKSVLTDVFILEMGRNGSAVFRLAGTRVCTIMGRELRGQEFTELWHAPNRHKMKLAAEAVLANQAPLTIDIHSFADEEDDGVLEMLLLPLFSRPGICDRLFGSLVDMSIPPLLGERDRLLSADRLNFIAPEQQAERLASVARSEPLSVAAARPRVTHLRVLEGGRKN